MDIIDIMLARAMTPQGQTDTYVAKANAAAAKANKAAEDATAAAETLTSASEDLAAAQELLETLQQMEINTLDTEDVDAEVKKLTVNANVVDGAGAKTIQMVTTYPDNTLNTQNLTKLYKATGQNEDGTMTQKAITDALGEKADTSALAEKADVSALAGKMDVFTLSDYATKSYVDSAVANIPSGSGSGSAGITYDVDDEGHIIIIGPDGKPIAGDITETTLIEALIRSGAYSSEDVIGIEVDYENKSFTRIQEAENKSAGQDFNQYRMYGGRMRCNVSDNGTINAFYGDAEYKDDGSNGEVMVYQPKFYYQRIPTKTEGSANGVIIKKETLLLSDKELTGFKLHPLFKYLDLELDYVLLPAYEGSIEDNKLNSRAGKKPVSNITITSAEIAARNHGTGWTITNMQFESAMQMLQMVEYGTMNSQNALEKGISNISSVSSYNCSSITGSTASLGNTTGVAATTTNEINGTYTDYSTNGKRAISYRGVENPWGNIWRMIGGMKIIGTNENNAGIPFFCTVPNYFNTNKYESVGFKLPSTYGWISAMGYGGKNYDWLYLPIECQNANSAIPVGDNLWTSPSLNGETILIAGGSWGFEESNGMFCYGSDRGPDDSSQKSYGARILYIPTEKNATYNTNITAWIAKMGE